MDKTEYLNRLPKSYLEVSAYIILLIIGFIDHITGTEISLSVFYLIPVFVVTRFTSRRKGIFISIAAAITWFLADLTSGHHYSSPLIPFWNASIRLGFFIIVTLLLSSLKNALELKDKLASTDSLTGAVNGRTFIELVNSEMRRAQRYKRPLTLVYLDLDNFKTVNDKYGHLIGDMLLRSVADIIRSNLRITDIMARLGGDEFAILLPEINPDGSKLVIDKLQTKLLHGMEKNNWPVTFSVGAVTFLKPPVSVDEMIKMADDLMYSAKRNGKNIIKHDVFGRE